jgi:uncharacterized membrane protein
MTGAGAGSNGYSEHPDMNDPRTILLTLFLFNGAVLIAMSLPLILGKVPPNPWYGFRVGRTLKDPAVWYAANRYAAWRMMAVGVAVLFVAPAVYFARNVSLVAYALTCAGVAVIGLTVALVQSFRYLWKLG